MDGNWKNVCMKCGKITNRTSCDHCGNKQTRILNHVFEEKKGETIFTTLLPLIPEIEHAYLVFEDAWNFAINADHGLVSNCERLREIVKAYNKIAMKAVEAMAEDTKDVNSPDTIRSVYGRTKSDYDIFFTPAFLKKLVARNSFR